MSSPKAALRAMGVLMKLSDLKTGRRHYMIYARHVVTFVILDSNTKKERERDDERDEILYCSDRQSDNCYLSGGGSWPAPGTTGLPFLPGNHFFPRSYPPFSPVNVFSIERSYKSKRENSVGRPFFPSFPA